MTEKHAGIQATELTNIACKFHQIRVTTEVTHGIYDDSLNTMKLYVHFSTQ